MGKPLKSKHLNKHKRLREQILSRQGVSAGKRKRLGHSSHFGKVEEIPIERKPSKGAALVEDAAGAGGKKKKSKFNKFKQAAADEDDAPGEKGKEQAPEVENPEKQKKQGIDARLPGESFTKFMKRLNKETQQMLVDQAAKSTHVVEKRRNFLNQRKKERKDKIVARRKGLHKIKEDSENEEDFALSEEQVRASVQAAPKFGEQVDRPPIIRMHKPLKGLLKQPAPDTNSSGGGYIVGGMPSIPEMSGDSLKKMQMEALRKNAISQYRKQMQVKRENNGFMPLPPPPRKGHY